MTQLVCYIIQNKIVLMTLEELHEWHAYMQINEIDEHGGFMHSDIINRIEKLED